MSQSEIENYELYKRNGLIVEQGTQTEPQVDAWKRQVEAITGHSTEGSRMGVRFKTKWQGYRIELYERSSVIMARGGTKLLSEYLFSLASKNKNRLAWLLNNEPDLAELLAEESPSQSPPSAA
jgi:hypothetical protein